MTKEARLFVQNILKREYNPLQDEIYAIIPEGRRDVAVVRAWLESRGKTFIFLVWKRNTGRLKFIQLKKAIHKKELHVDQIVIQNKMIIVSIDAGEGYNKRHLMEKQEIPLSDLKGIKK